METNLTLTANRWQLAPHLQRTAVFGGVLMVKNIVEGTYLKITRPQWLVLECFREARTVPAVLQEIILGRTCPALGEFYELILKAVHAGILVDPARELARRPVVNWPISIRPAWVRLPLWLIFLASLTVILWRPPVLPTTWIDLGASVGGVVVAGFVAAALAASLLRGAGGEVYVSRGFLLRTRDACMLPPKDQRAVASGFLAMIALATAALTWHCASWGLVPMVALLALMRPFLGGVIARIIRLGASRRPSDAESDFIFSENRTARMRWRSLLKTLRMPTTWGQIAYGILWTLMLGYVFGVSAGVAPWTIEFWEERGLVIAIAVVGSLAVLGLVYLSSELYLYLRARAYARRDTMRLWWRRWFGQVRFEDDGAECHRALVRSPLLRQLSPPAHQALADAMTSVFAWPWRTLKDFDEPVTKVGLIRSGKVGVYRRTFSGRRELVQVLCENDVVGLHPVADPRHPIFMYRSLTPVVLFEVSWEEAQRLILGPLGSIDLANPVQKLPFLSRISLCQHWHVQAIQRFAELSRLLDYREGDVILQHGFYSESFYILFEGQARVKNAKGVELGVVQMGDFFGEIGLLQNSNTTANVVAGRGTRCLCIPRSEFLRFVTHNYTVALTLEAVSSARLGRPIFPMVAGSFEQL
jgi:CRP-like cAMP-binding protein